MLPCPRAAAIEQLLSTSREVTSQGQYIESCSKKKSNNHKILLNKKNLKNWEQEQKIFLYKNRFTFQKKDRNRTKSIYLYHNH